MTGSRVDGRSPNEIRQVVITPGSNPYAEGSVEVRFGSTRLMITASVVREVPRWMAEDAKSGWITAEYGMLPRATHERSQREAAAGKQAGRTLEIQRLIGRALRAAVDLQHLSGLTIKLDCDVLVADGGTRTAAISGGWVALAQAVRWAVDQGLAAPEAKLRQIAAVSAGVVEGRKLLDLCYQEDAAAQFDLNLVFNEQQELIEIQGTAERGALHVSDLNALITLGLDGAQKIMVEQVKALANR